MDTLKCIKVTERYQGKQISVHYITHPEFINSFLLKYKPTETANWYDKQYTLFGSLPTRYVDSQLKQTYVLEFDFPISRAKAKERHEIAERLERLLHENQLK